MRLKKSNRISIYDIARKLNVSAVTVSKVMRGHPDISNETALKVKHLAASLGYLPNYNARNLSSIYTNTIGVVVPTVAHPFFSLIIESMYETAIKYNYDIILGVSRENPEREMKQVQSLLSMRVDGIVISVVKGSKNKVLFNKIVTSKTPLTFFDRVMNIRGANKVVVDDFGGVYTGITHAINYGHKKIGYIGGALNSNIGRNRFRGYKEALREHGIDLQPELVVLRGFSRSEGYNGFIQLFRRKERPSVIFIAGSNLLLGVLAAIEDLRLTVPDDIDIIPFTVNSMEHPPIKNKRFIEQPCTELGKIAIETTIENIRNRTNFRCVDIVLPFQDHYKFPEQNENQKYYKINAV